MAQFLKDIFEPGGFCARIGGDEFVAAYPVTDEGSVKKLVGKLKENFAEFNQNSNKPYYVECSVGFTYFDCTPEFNFEEALKSADDYLYEEKCVRRKDVRK